MNMSTTPFNKLKWPNASIMGTHRIDKEMMKMKI